MKRAIALATILILIATVAQAGNNKSGFGIGIMAGEPTGISMKLWLSEANALDAGVAWSLENNNSFQLQVDYVMHKFSLINVGDGSLPLYFGLGGRLRFRENGSDDIGVRVPVGLDYLFEDTPIDIFGEIVPILDLSPSTEFDINAAVGARFYF